VPTDPSRLCYITETDGLGYRAEKDFVRELKQAAVMHGNDGIITKKVIVPLQKNQNKTTTKTCLGSPEETLHC